MRPLHHAIDVDATPAAAYAVLTRLAAWPRWFPHARAARPLVEPVFAAGGSLELTLQVAVRGAVKVRLEVVEAVPPLRLRLVGRLLGARGDHGYTLEERGGWTRVTSHQTLTGPMTRLLTTRVWTTLDQSAHEALARFKQLVEAPDADRDG